MAVIDTTPVDGQSYRTFTMDAGTIIGVVLTRTIPAGPWQGTGAAGSEQGDVRVRPTNVTATVSHAAGAEPDVILLHNGPNGGFTQQFKPTTAAANFRTNSVVRAIITST